MNTVKDSLFSQYENSNRVICGIDEAGRGPLAGPLIVAGVILKGEIDGLGDSKRISSIRREKLSEKIVENSKYYIYEASATKIDTFGLSYCIKEALNEIKDFFGKNVTYIFDGNSSFGVDSIQPIVKADSKIAEVSAASILAKVIRDRKMRDFATLYPEYGFEKHKGYGTKAHIDAINKFGYCEIHRKSFKIKSLSQPTLNI